MNDDKKLLELAAKAAGIRITWSDTYDKFFRDGYALGQNPFWNPLADDGDALRLAVTLRLGFKDFACQFDDMPGMVEVWLTEDADPLHTEWYKIGDDRFAVTRRAIVRAAAEIGKTL